MIEAIAGISAREPPGLCLGSAHKPLEVFCIQVHALETMAARSRLAAHPNTL